MTGRYRRSVLGKKLNGSKWKMLATHHDVNFPNFLFIRFEQSHVNGWEIEQVDNNVKFYVFFTFYWLIISLNTPWLSEDCRMSPLIRFKYSPSTTAMTVLGEGAINFHKFHCPPDWFYFSTELLNMVFTAGTWTPEDVSDVSRGWANWRPADIQLTLPLSQTSHLRVSEQEGNSGQLEVGSYTYILTFPWYCSNFSWQKN